MPSTEPSSVTALARKSGWAQVSATALRRPTVTSTPISPSGAITGSPARTPLARPRPSRRVRPSVGPVCWSTSAGAVAKVVRAGRPRRARSRSFSGRGAATDAAALDPAEPGPAGAAPLGALLQPEQRHQRRVPQPLGDPETEPVGKSDRAHGEQQAGQEEEGIAP